MARTQKPAFSLGVGSHAADTLVVVRFTGREALSCPYDFQLEFFARDGQVLELAELSNTQVLLTIRLGEVPLRHVHGWVRQAEALGRIGGRWHYRVRVRPKLERLRQTQDSRIFQELTVPDIVKALLGEWRVEHRFLLSRSYAVREYCVQYRESDFAFISRLLEEEGIFYFFEHAEDGHTLVLGDVSNAHVALPGGPVLPLRPEDGRAHDEEFISRLERVHRLRPGEVMLRDFDFKKPGLDLSTRSSSVEGLRVLELYDYPGAYVAPGEGQGLVRTRMEEKAQGARTYTGRSVCPRLAPGYLFEAESPGEGTWAGFYLVEEVVHSGQQPDTLGAPETLGEVYHNDFRALPKGVPFRPMRVTPRPRIPGIQTATVSGPASEEIHTDEYGRIKVQFHWDREGQHNERSSCWMRVGQGWGGLGWGAVYLPRIGQEVVVRFLEGDPDRPLIAGTVYNGGNAAPYGLPGDKTKTTLKSSSSLGGAGFNEVRSEDSAGKEEIFTHAQKDESLITENDKSQEVRGYEDLLVKKDRSLCVEWNQELTVELNDSNLIEGNQRLRVSGNRSTTTHENHGESVQGNQGITVGSNFTSMVNQATTEGVGAAKALTIGGGYSINVGLGMAETTGGLKAVEVGAAMIELVGIRREESVGQNKQTLVGLDFESQCGGGMTQAAGQSLQENVGGKTSVSAKEGAGWLAKKFVLTAEDTFTLLVGGQLILKLEKSGAVTFMGKTLTIDSKETQFRGGTVHSRP
ncbi:type VI secretion system Vgr family protein [Hyalangium minutum]|uniref:VgrG protein n=1 Tax=Hyalangium minutum TaxID=394096 RepID=A0A085WIT1_9BACT|nr:type VI secretion system tip protein TssI/VgrG [Hyalangium minutum]KFE67594.1 VgrG protein [Hyalangium minutum]